MVAKKQGVSPWIKFGLPVFVLVAVGAIVGGVLGSKASKNNSSGSASAEAAASSAASAKLEIGRFATATNSEFMVPVYPSTTNSAAFSAPTFQASSDLAWPQDSFKPKDPSPTNVRTDRPRLIAPQYKWDHLPQIIPKDPYLRGWNDTIFGNCTLYAKLDPVKYYMDGGSGILDNAREVKMRVKAFAYCYRMTNSTQWSDLAWRELNNAMSANFGPDDDKWNSKHFLDVAEFSAAFGIAYDWLYNVFTNDQKTQMRAALLKYGLNLGLKAFTDATVTYAWWKTNIQGNWNCVCNGGLTLGALAILGDDDSGTAQQLLGYTIDNAKANCVDAVSSDGTWAETPNYWYFGTTGHAEMSSALITATGSDYGPFDRKRQFQEDRGPTSLFDYGDHGPNKFSATANCMFLYSSYYNIPRYALFQRDQRDAAEPWSMFWYDASISGAFWDEAPLDAFFDDALDQWVSMRSSWTDFDGHQNHQDLDVGDFVLDAMGTRWAGEYGSGDYLATGYFDGDAQTGPRWNFFRTRTEGQSTILINGGNQNINAAPTVKHDSSGTKQSGDTTVYTVPDDSTAFWTTDMTSAYNDATSVKRGVRLLNKRRQVLIQDEINASGTVEWRMHTNATITTSGTTATLQRDGKTLNMSILNAPSGAQFSTSEAKRETAADGVTDQANPGITVLKISLPAGQYTLQVLFNPQWEGMSASDFKTPGSVALDNWSLTSHN
ncbi:heparinase II/III family protein [Flagelloscypha sp. PMI_526]|nr:heparinase II/III family protein [Flagelloscypha sp. PMI_526]